MAKVWKDANEVIKMVHDLENDRLRNIDREMTRKPNFDKSKINLKNIDKKEGKPRIK